MQSKTASPIDLNAPDCPALLKPEQVAPLLGCARSTVYAYIAAGTVPVIRLSSRRFLIPAEGLRRMLAGEAVSQ